jgi:hypothetical protein
MIPAHLTSSLSAAADTEIDHALQYGAPGQHPPTGEVGFVAAFVLGAVPGIAQAWRAILRPHGLSVRMTGVFCHQTPRASFTDASGNVRSCELSDLLVVVEDFTTGSSGRRWATLIQAKMANTGGGTTLSAPGDMIQLDLMTRWPNFTLPSAYAPGARNFSTCRYPGTTIECGRYGLIEPSPNVDWHQQAPATSMPPGGDTLGGFLAHMVETGQRGYGREATGTGDDWSRTVDELMRVTSAQAFTHAASFSGQRQRGVSAIASASDPNPPFWPYPEYWYGLVGDLSLPSGGRPDWPEVGEGEPEGEGISQVRIGITKIEEGDG